MPFSICPVCGNLSHLSVSNVAEWYASNCPEVPAGGPVTGLCFLCWQEIAAGDAVEIRENHRGVRVGARGNIKKLVSSKGGTVYIVALEVGNETLFVRSEIRKLRGAEIQPNAVAAEKSHESKD